MKAQREELDLFGKTMIERMSRAVKLLTKQTIFARPKTASYTCRSTAKGRIMAEEMKFKAGDVVVLKSGGPKMTIIRTDQEGDAVCLWYDGNEYKTKIFKPVVLAG